MPCQWIALRHGTAVLACGPRPRRCRCSICRMEWATKRCDFPKLWRSRYELPPKRDHKTCDKPLCDKCARKVGPGHDYCPAHPTDQVQLGLGL